MGRHPLLTLTDWVPPRNNTCSTRCPITNCPFVDGICILRCLPFGAAVLQARGCARIELSTAKYGLLRTVEVCSVKAGATSLRHPPFKGSGLGVLSSAGTFRGMRILGSDAVFVGMVISERSVPPRGSEYDGWVYVLTVKHLFGGPRTKTIAVFTENSSARFPPSVGKQYLLFATRMGGRLELDGCSNSRLVSEADESIRLLRNLKPPGDALIEGRISFSGIPDNGTHVAGLQVNIRGLGRKFSATSDENGRFHLNVPAGTYSAEVRRLPEWKIAPGPSDLSADSPKNFEARKGHCSGLQFVAYKQPLQNP